MSNQSSGSTEMLDNLKDRPLRIALVHAADQGGGAEVCTLALFRALQALGHECRLLVGAKLGDDADIEEIKRFRCLPGVLRGVQWIEQATGWQYLYHPWFRRLDQLLGPDVDIVHFGSLWKNRQGYAELSALPRLTQLYPTMLTLHDMWMLTGHCACPAIGCERWQIGCGRCPDLTIPPAIPRDGTRANWRRKQTAIQRSKLRVTTVSRWLAAQVASCPVFDGKVPHTVYNGIDPDHFHPRDRQEMRRKLGLPEDRFIIMIAGQSVEGFLKNAKGAANYAIEALTQSQTDPYVVAVGRSSEKVLGMWPGAGRAIGFQSDPSTLAEYYCASDVTLVTSLWETFGRVPAEAQMCGVPVAAFNTGGIPEVVEHDLTGIIVDRMNSSALGAAICRLKENPLLRMKMGEAAVRRSVNLFGTTAVAKRYLQHYYDEIRSRQSPAEGNPLPVSSAETAVAKPQVIQAATANAK